VTRTSTRRLVTALVLALIVLLGTAAWLTTWLARNEPEFNQYLKMVPLLKPFRYYPPAPPSTPAWLSRIRRENLTLSKRQVVAVTPAPPAWVPPPMPGSLTLSERQVVAVTITAIANSGEFFLGPQRIVSDATLTLKGAIAEDLAMAWNAQSVDCGATRPRCFSPSFKLDFLNDDGSHFSASLGWYCGIVGVDVPRGKKRHYWDGRCVFYTELPQAEALFKTLHTLIRPALTYAELDKN
jgi:hypothetical protein